MTKQWGPLVVGQWAAISPFFNVRRKRKHNLRKILDCILWVLRTGSQWRNIHSDWLPWQAVYYYFDQINATLNQLDRQQREPLPSVLCIDTQSVKLSPMVYEHRGMDAHKRVNGRKRTFVVDT